MRRNQSSSISVLEAAHEPVERAFEAEGVGSLEAAGVEDRARQGDYRRDEVGPEACGNQEVGQGGAVWHLPGDQLGLRLKVEVGSMSGRDGLFGRTGAGAAQRQKGRQQEEACDLPRAGRGAVTRGGSGDRRGPEAGSQRVHLAKCSGRRREPSNSDGRGHRAGVVSRGA